MFKTYPYIDSNVRKESRDINKQIIEGLFSQRWVFYQCHKRPEEKHLKWRPKNSTTKPDVDRNKLAKSFEVSVWNNRSVHIINMPIPNINIFCLLFLLDIRGNLWKPFACFICLFSGQRFTLDERPQINWKIEVTLLLWLIWKNKQTQLIELKNPRNIREQIVEICTEEICSNKM